METKKYLAKVLLVEDNRVDSAMACEMLRARGLTVHLARGLDVVDHLDESFQMIFLDLSMPGIDGFYIANTFRKPNGLNKSTPIVFVSSRPYSDAIKEQCISANVSGYIEKPMTPGVLDAVLDQLLSKFEVPNIPPAHQEPRGFIRVER